MFSPENYLPHFHCREKLFENNPKQSFLAEVIINTYYETKQYKEASKVI